MCAFILCSNFERAYAKNYSEVARKLIECICRRSASRNPRGPLIYMINLIIYILIYYIIAFVLQSRTCRVENRFKNPRRIHSSVWYRGSNMVYETSYASGTKPFSPDPKRGKWEKPTDYLFACFGLALKLDIFEVSYWFFFNIGCK